jgi:hypothetical protein
MIAVALLIGKAYVNLKSNGTEIEPRAQPAPSKRGASPNPCFLLYSFLFGCGYWNRKPCWTLQCLFDSIPVADQQFRRLCEPTAVSESKRSQKFDKRSNCSCLSSTYYLISGKEFLQSFQFHRFLHNRSRQIWNEFAVQRWVVESFSCEKVFCFCSTYLCATVYLNLFGSSIAQIVSQMKSRTWPLSIDQINHRLVAKFQLLIENPFPKRCLSSQFTGFDECMENEFFFGVLEY